MLRFADISLGTGAPPRCNLCHGAAEESFLDTSVVTAQIEAVARSWDLGPGPNLTLTGAEPLRHPDLPAILASAVAAGVERIRLETDASALMGPQEATWLIQAGARHLSFTVLGPSAAAHDRLAGSHGSFDGTVRGVQAFSEAAESLGKSVHVTARIPVCRHNLEGLPNAVTAAAKAGAASVLLIANDVHLDLRTAAPWFEAACDTGTVNAIWVEVEGVPYGVARGWELHLARTYRVYEGEKSAKCDSCALAPVCPGGIMGLSPEVLATFRPPDNAARLAEGVARGFSPPCLAVQ